MPNLRFAVFLVLVIVLGTFLVGLTMIDFQSSIEGSAADVTPDLACVKNIAANGTTTVHCHLTESEGVDRVVVQSGDETLVVDDEAPYKFTIRPTTSRQTPGVNGFEWICSPRTAPSSGGIRERFR